MSYFGSILVKENKTDADAYVLSISMIKLQAILEEIKNYQFYETFFAQHFKDIDMQTLLELCKNFRFERIDKKKLVFKQGDPSNMKFYVIISGEVCVVSRQNVGDWGTKKGEMPPELKTNTETHHLSGKNPNRTSIDLESTTKETDSKLNEVKESDLPEETPSAHNTRKILQGFHRHSVNAKTSRKSVRFKKIIGSSHSKDEVDSLHEIHHHQASIEKLPEPMTPKTPMTPMTPMSSGRFSNLIGFSRVVSVPSETNIMRRSNATENSVTTPSHKTVTVVEPDKQEQAAALPGAKGMAAVLKSVTKFKRAKLGNDDLRAKGPNSHQINFVGGMSAIDEEDEEFFKMANSYGKIIRFMKPGESFGELALKRNAPRSATIVTRTVVELLVLTKKHYNDVFERAQREREEFLRSNIPMFKIVGSSANLNFLLYSFKTETHIKGSTLTKEGPTNTKNPKFYIIMRGECSVEKKIVRPLKDPFERGKIILETHEEVLVSRIGRGVFCGEEVIENENNYEYTVKVSSEDCIAQSITLNDFKFRFPTECIEEVKSLYRTKKLQYMDLISAHARGLKEFKESDQKREHFYLLNNSKMAGLILKSTAPNLSRVFQREKQNVEEFQEYINPMNSMVTPQSKTIKLPLNLESLKKKSIEVKTKINLRLSNRIKADNEHEHFFKTQPKENTWNDYILTEPAPNIDFDRYSKGSNDSPRLKLNFHTLDTHNSSQAHTVDHDTRLTRYESVKDLKELRDYDSHSLSKSKFNTLTPKTESPSKPFNRKSDGVGTIGYMKAKRPPPLDGLQARLDFLATTPQKDDIETNDNRERLRQTNLFRHEKNEIFIRHALVKMNPQKYIENTVPNTARSSADYVIVKFLRSPDNMELAKKYLRNESIGPGPTNVSSVPSPLMTPSLKTLSPGVKIPKHTRGLTFSYDQNKFKKKNADTRSSLAIEVLHNEDMRAFRLSGSHTSRK